ncbi:YaaW family protein [uncultured Megasphaera sp.]|uniref:YaaW family protein n=1 Tax=uncultured Megasphaera sp. TaxID=165188 RepID=UPI00261164D4|nr:ubiquinol-cytochrome C chaperone family protein [uncultured Megasphaera sp.]
MHHDPDLDLLNTFSNDELEPIVKLITKKGSMSQALTQNAKYKTYYPDHQKYVEAIKDELSLMGGNSVANFFRRRGVSYREMVMDVCDQLDAPYNKKFSTEHIEHRLLEKIIEDAWKKMSQEEKAEVLQKIGNPEQGSLSMTNSTLISLFRAGGVASYRISLMIANSLCQSISGRGLALTRNATLIGLPMLIGPLGFVISAIRVAGPAYRVTVPAVTYIAALRNAHHLTEWDGPSL